jgi:mannitol/fructose-specific phosphotransferase system IIA component (Ntr-type)
MNDKEFFLQYNINWKQEYQNWYSFVDKMTEALLESSDMTEAKEVIARIKKVI